MKKGSVEVFNQKLFFVSLVLVALLGIVFIFLSSQNLILAFIIALSCVLFITFYKFPLIGVYLIMISIIPGQLVKIPLEGGQGILLTDILAPLLLVFWLLRKIIKREKIKSTLLGPLIFLFLLIAGLSYLNGLRFIEYSEAMISLFYLLRLVSYASLFFIALDTIKEERDIYQYKKVFFLIFLIIAIAGLIQTLVFPSLTELARTGGWDPHTGRLFSTFLDPNFVGCFLVIGFNFLILFLSQSKSIESKIVLAISILVVLTAIILTYSRSAYLFLLISFLLIALFRSRKLLFWGCLIIIVLVLIFPRSLERIEGGFQIDESAKDRFRSWERAFVIANDHPFLGVGYNSLRYAQVRYGYIKEGAYDQTSSGIDSSFLTIIVTTGYIGLIAYLIFYIMAIKKSLSVFVHSKSSHQKSFALAIAITLIGLIFNSLFINSLFYAAIIIPIFIALGIISVRLKKTS